MSLYYRAIWHYFSTALILMFRITGSISPCFAGVSKWVKIICVDGYLKFSITVKRTYL